MAKVVGQLDKGLYPQYYANLREMGILYVNTLGVNKKPMQKPIIISFVCQGMCNLLRLASSEIAGMQTPLKENLMPHKSFSYTLAFDILPIHLL